MHGKHNCPVISYPVGLAIHLDRPLSGSFLEAAEQKYCLAALNAWKYLP